MKLLKQVFLSLVIVSLLLASIILLVGRKTEQELNNFSMLPDGVEVVDKVILGRRERNFFDDFSRAYYLELGNGFARAFRRGAISLVCTNQDSILLVEQDFRIPRRYVGPGASGKGLFKVHSQTNTKGGRVEIKNVKMLTRQYFDTIVSDPLSSSEIVEIQKVLKIKNIRLIALKSFDGGSSFISEYQVSDVNQLINNCQFKNFN